MTVQRRKPGGGRKIGTATKFKTVDDVHPPCGTRVRYASTRQCVHCHRAKMRGKSVEFLAHQQSPPAEDAAEAVLTEHNRRGALTDFTNDLDIGDLL